MITPHLTLHRLLESSEIAGEIGAAEFIVECSGTDRPLDHDVERGGDALWLAVGFLPGLAEIRNIEVGDREAGQAGLGTRAAASRALVTDLAAGAGGCAREGRDRGRVVVRLDFGEDMSLLVMIAESAVGIGIQAGNARAFDDRGVIRIRDHRAVRVGLVRILDHAEQGLLHRPRVDHPVGVEDLVTAVLGIGLGEHHQLDVGRIAPGAAEIFDKVVDLIVGKRQTKIAIRALKRGAPASEDIDRGERLRRIVVKQGVGLVLATEHGLGHAVMQQGEQRGVPLNPACIDRIRNAALDAHDLVETALVRDIRRLR